MPFYKNILSFIGALFIAIAAAGQNDPVRLTSYGFDDGLSHRNVFGVQQDTNGFLWIATEKGLNRYDGHRFLNKENGPKHLKFPIGPVHDFCIDPAANCLWLSQGESILRFSPDENRLDTILPKQPTNPGGLRYNNLTTDSSGTLWATCFSMADTSASLRRMSKKGKLVDVARLPGHYERRPMASVGNLLYLGAYENEIWVFDENGRQVKQFEFPAPASDKSYARTVVLQARPDGSIWALLEHGQVYFLKRGSNVFTRHPLSDIVPGNMHPSALWVNERTDIWIGGIVAPGGHGDGSPCSSIQAGATLLHYDAASGSLHDYSYYLKQVMPHTEPPRQFFEDRTGVIWISSFFGLVDLTENNLFARYLSDGNDCCRNGVCSMRGITEDEAGNIYFSYYNSIHVLNPTSGSLTPLFSPDVKEVGSPFGLCYYKGALWTGDGLRIDLKDLQIDTLFKAPENIEGVVMAGREGTLWFAYQDRLLMLDTKNSRTLHIEDKSALWAKGGGGQITFLLQGKQDSLIWIATRENGFYKINKEKASLRHYHKANLPGLPHDRILAMAETRGKLWLATAAGLVCMAAPNDSLQVFTTQNGLPNDFINGLLPEGDSAVWASTDNGLCRLDVNTGNVASFFQADGLPNNEFNRISFHLAADGRMYFGGLNGIAAFYPSPRYGEKAKPATDKLMLTEFAKYDGKTDSHQNFGLTASHPIELTYRDEMFTFWFSLADFSDPKLHRYSYRLEGWDKVWSEPSPINFARYFNIPAGNYTLKVRASTGGGNWVENQLSVPVVIRQAFYKTRVFQLLALGFLTVLIYGIMRYRLYLLRQHEKELESMVQVRTKELESEKQKSEELLLNILPAETAEELKQFGAAKARRFENVTVMFTDFKGFTVIAGEMEPEALVAEIDYCFRAFDEITELYRLEKIKTIGDAYLCAGGFSQKGEVGPAVRVVQAALEIQAFLNAIAHEREEQGKPHFEARIGIHSGPVVAGIVGIKKFAYDIWGDTVNIAQRMQSNGEVGKVNISKSTFELVKDHFECVHRGKIAAKNKGDVDMYFVGCSKD